MDAQSYGAASRAAIRELGGIFTYLPSVQAIGIAASQPVAYNPNRITLQVVNVGPTIVTLSPLQGPTSGSGILLLNNGSAMTLNWHDDADLVAQGFYGIGNLAGGFVYVLEGVQTGLEART